MESQIVNEIPMSSMMEQMHYSKINGITQRILTITLPRHSIFHSLIYRYSMVNIKNSSQHRTPKL